VKKVIEGNIYVPEIESTPYVGFKAIIEIETKDKNICDLLLHPKRKAKITIEVEEPQDYILEGGLDED
jgi:hypothetical protein